MRLLDIKPGCWYLWQYGHRIFPGKCLAILSNRYYNIEVLIPKSNYVGYRLAARHSFKFNKTICLQFNYFLLESDEVLEEILAPYEI